MTKRKSECLVEGIRVLTPSELAAKHIEPYFITHLLAPERNHDCCFVLGYDEITKIGAVKLMLLAHSPYFRARLHEIKTNEPEMIIAPDLTSETVTDLLRYVYGYDNTSTLSFERANRLLYAADKFILDSLKNNLAVHLTSLLSYENVCTLMNNPVCTQLLSLKSSINKVLQNETEKILENPSFLNLDVDAFVNILEQDALAVPEIELWRAALKWATKRAGSNEGRFLRSQLEVPLKYIRLCSLSPMDLCKEVVPIGVLTDAEVRMVTTSVGLGEKQSGLTLICNETECRRNSKQSDLSESHVAIFPGFTPKSRIKVMSLNIITKDCALELLPFEFTAKKRPNLEDNETYECSCTIQVINEITDSTTFIGFSQHIKYGEPFTVPVQSKGKNVKLLSHSEYLMKMTFTQPIWYYSSRSSSTFENQHFQVRFTLQKEGWYLSPITKLPYKCVTG